MIYIKLYFSYEEDTKLFLTTISNPDDYEETFWTALVEFYDMHSKQLKLMASTLFLSIPVFGILFYVLRK